MMTTTKTMALICFFAMASTRLFAQEQTDFQTRFNAEVSYKLNKKWKIATQYRYALDHDSQVFRSSAMQFETTYKINKKSSLLAGYRFTTSFEENNHRFLGGYEYQHKWNQFTFQSTSRIQYALNSFDSDFLANYKSPVLMFREKIQANYNVPKSRFSFAIAAETFFKIDKEPLLKWNRMRYSTALNYDFKKEGKIGLQLFYDDKINPENKNRLVLATKYQVALDGFFKKKDNDKKKKKNKKEDNEMKKNNP